ncbi:hypothetical protein T12_6917 [Trichinella patagoniensis]|uniref:Uncharacterized protein n=1 Tax=Trichinella patagoniensis TaxID=990121 RepID=A0A0V0Z5Q8_9BILA|nr:hypothetical protein T12_6917 [Trichinella patagoniensis]
MILGACIQVLRVLLRHTKSGSDFGTDHLALSCPTGISVSLTVIGPNTFSTFNEPTHDFLKTVVVVPEHLMNMRLVLMQIS